MVGAGRPPLFPRCAASRAHEKSARPRRAHGTNPASARLAGFFFDRGDRQEQARKGWVDLMGPWRNSEKLDGTSGPCS